MKLLELLPEKNRCWFPVIFQIGESSIINEVESDIKTYDYMRSTFYQTRKLRPFHYYKPVMII